MEKQTKGHIERFDGNLWVCDSCGFGFPAYHNDGSPHEHSCPNCAETQAKALIAGCQGIPAEALTPGSIKALIDALAPFLAPGVNIPGRLPDTHPISFTLGDVRRARMATVRFDGTQEVKPDAESPA